MQKLPLPDADVKFSRSCPGVDDRELFAHLNKLPKGVWWKAGSRVRCAFGDKGTYLRGGNTTSVAKIWTPYLEKVRDHLQKFTHKKFNFVLINKYTGADSYIKYHSDSETNSEPLIVSLSVGGTRDFLMCNKADRRAYKISLNSGSVLVMDGKTNKNYWHAVPHGKGAEKDIVRYNLTFRQVYLDDKNKEELPAVVKCPPDFQGPWQFVEPNDKRCNLLFKNWGNAGEITTDPRDIAEKRALVKKSAAYKRNPHAMFEYSDYFIYAKNLKQVSKDFENLLPYFRYAFPRADLFLPPYVEPEVVVSIYMNKDKAKIPKKVHDHTKHIDVTPKTQTSARVPTARA